MKSLKTILLVLISILVNSITTRASHMMGADITYKSLGSNKYLITITVYRDCRGIPLSAPGSYIRCNGNQVASFTPTEISVRDISPVCVSAGKPCTPQNTTSGKGVEEHVYTYTYDFTTIKKNGCCSVEIGTGQCCRNSDITTGASGSDFWVTAYLNLCVKTPNNSPVFYSPSRAFFKCNQPVYYNFAARDYLDNDSLVYEMVDPMQNWSSKTNWGGSKNSKMPFSVYCTGSCIPASPTSFPPKGFYLDRFTGDLIFTPTDCNESTIAAISVSEYRKDSTGKYVRIGIVTRDHQSWVMTMADNNVPIIDGPGNIYLPDSTESSVTYSTRDFVVPTKGSPVLNDTVKFKMVSAPTKLTDTTFKIIDSKQKNPIGVFKWKPMGLNNSRPYLLILEATDNACPYTGRSYKSVKVFVRKKSELAWVEGTVFTDINFNCKRDSFEKVIPNAWISADSGRSVVFIADSLGHFSGWFAAGNCNLRVTGNYASFICNKTINLVAGKTNKLELGGTTSKMHLSGLVYSDSIKNCKADSLEPKLKNYIVYTDPGDFTSTTDSKGGWQLDVPAGNTR